MGFSSAVLICMALNVYHEARSEPVSGQLAVAHVVMNRVKANGTDVCTEVYKPKQFSWTHTLSKKEKIPTDLNAWREAQLLSFIVLNGLSFDNTNGATYYHATYVDPYWNDVKYVSRTKRIAQHIFYKKIKLS